LEKNDLKEVGLKITVPRVKILKILEKEAVEKHVTAEKVYNQLLNDGEEIGLATVYRVLTQFEQAGLVVRHHFDADTSVFELNRGGHHDHIVCMKCGKVDEFFDNTVEQRQKAIALELGYELTDHHLNLYGYCLQCKQG
jgi:Fur family ferric uptake transcriptional regulator